MKYESIIGEMGQTVFPSFEGERVYMRAFTKADGLPFDLARWQPTVDAMLRYVDSDGPIYLMVDQSKVAAGTSHRRPGLHIDGYWNPGISAHGGTGPRHSERPAPNEPSPGEHHAHRHSSRANGVHDYWEHATFEEPEAIILASDVTGARAYEGIYHGVIGAMGDCSQIDPDGLRPVLLKAGHVYAGNVTCLHESLVIPFDCERTVVRLNVPGWTP